MYMFGVAWTYLAPLTCKSLDCYLISPSSYPHLLPSPTPPLPLVFCFRLFVYAAHRSTPNHVISSPSPLLPTDRPPALAHLRPPLYRLPPMFSDALWAAMGIIDQDLPVITGFSSRLPFVTALPMVHHLLLCTGDLLHTAIFYVLVRALVLLV